MFKKQIAYFSMGSGIYNDLLTYSGGLEILAGDMIKEVMDHPDKYHMTFFHILWKKGYSFQRVTQNGSVVDYDPPYNAWAKYLVDTGKEVSVTIFGREVAAKIWKLKNGPVYYLDADLEKNGDLCNITHRLYGGAWDNPAKERIAQEMILGIGGARAIKALGLKVDGYHYNDGHPAFVGLELINQRMEHYAHTRPELDDNARFELAWKYVKDRTAFTTHTNVPAGNEYHSIDLMMEMGANVGLTKEQLERIGGKPVGMFGMTDASLRMATVANGVSRLQVVAAKGMWYYIKEAPNLIAITNGVHPGTWWAPDIKAAYYRNDLVGIYDAHEHHKADLIQYIYDRTGTQFRQHSLLIGFARRATGYKRWDLIFRNRERFEDLIKYHDIQIVFAGKAHPHDKEGKRFIADISRYSKMYPNNVVFLEGYDIELAQKLVSGTDVWLNNPVVPKEACGTSGMKAAMNGTLNLSTLDGWWREGAQNGVNGFNIGNGEILAEPQADVEDSINLMKVLRYEVVPAFNDKKRWRSMMFASIATAQQYSTGRMVEEYYVNLYNHLKEY